jgi:CDP-paratose 2-epimerase
VQPGGDILITGGAGFVGASLAVWLAKRRPDARVVAFDNLARRGSELNLPRLREAGVQFVHGDVRELGDLLALGPVGQLVECSAEPSVMAGVTSGPGYLVRTNLLGAYHCLELARRDGARVVFLSTSRVYPVRGLREIALEEDATRFRIAEAQRLPGVSAAGISESFPMRGARTLYGATKLSAELLVEEYRETYGLAACVLRFGVIAGPWQMGRVDQGVFAYWALAHAFGRPLRYIGFGGSGRQVRDLLHVDDAAELIDEVLRAPDAWDGLVANVGGGPEVSLSLAETTALCEEISGRRGLVQSSGEERPGDVPLYISDTGKLQGMTSWRPQRSARRILEDVFEWIAGNEALARTIG